MNVDAAPSVLIVDDDREVLVSFKIWLSDEGFNVLTAVNSSEALKILDEEGAAVVLVDFRLGTENGLTVARTLKEIDETMKVIIITGYPSHETAVKTIKAGLFDYISKSASNNKILETIKKAVQARERDILERGEAVSRENILKLIVICKHSLIKERLGSFSRKYLDFKLIRSYNSIEQLREAEYVPEVDIVMICANCCVGAFENVFLFFDELYKLLPMSKPVVFNETFSDMEKVDLIKIGVKGFFSIDMDSEDLEKALSSIKEGDIWVPRKLVAHALTYGPEYLKNYLSGVNSYGLSGREKEILRAMILGLTNKEIADKLFISEMTVKSHLNRIFKKFGVNNRTKAIRFAMDNKIL